MLLILDLTLFRFVRDGPGHKNLEIVKDLLVDFDLLIKRLVAKTIKRLESLLPLVTLGHLALQLFNFVKRDLQLSLFAIHLLFEAGLVLFPTSVLSLVIGIVCRLQIVALSCINSVKTLLMLSNCSLEIVQLRVRLFSVVNIFDAGNELLECQNFVFIFLNFFNFFVELLTVLLVSNYFVFIARGRDYLFELLSLFVELGYQGMLWQCKAKELKRFTIHVAEKSSNNDGGKFHP